MSMILKGAPVAKVLNEQMKFKVSELKEQGIEPMLAILRVGNRVDDISYEKGAIKRCEQVGVKVASVVLPADVDEGEFFATLTELNENCKVHGILMMRPLPEHIDGEKARQMLVVSKDVDGCTDGSLAAVFANMREGFAPCTAQAAIEILDHYGIACEGKKVAVVGRSLVVGRPVSMLLMHKNATVTICHSKTKELSTITKEADIVVVCSGQMESIGADYLKEGQIIIDVGIGWNEVKGKLCGDVNYDEVEPVVAAITPVPGGVGAVTTSVLVSHVVEAAKRLMC